MKTRFSRIFAALAFAFVISFSAASAASAATLTPISVSAAYTAVGNKGCTVSGASVATPSVITCVAAHRLVDGDPIQITGIGGTTTDNTVGYAKVTTFSATTFGFYQDAALTTGVTGTGAYTSGGVVSFAFPVSSITGDWTLRLRTDALTAAVKALLVVEQSSDGFVSDIQQIFVVNPLGALGQANGNTSESTLRSYQIPSAKMGVSNETIRLRVQSIGSGTWTGSFFIEF